MPSNDSPSLSRMPSKSRNSFKRQNTTDSNQSTARINTLKRPKSFKSQAEQKAVKPKKHQEKVAAYWPLTWDLLLGFLLKKWPNEAFEGQKSGDYWVFEVPQLLTEEDKRDIARLRDNAKAQCDDRRKSVTPE